MATLPFLQRFAERHSASSAMNSKQREHDHVCTIDCHSTVPGDEQIASMTFPLSTLLLFHVSFQETSTEMLVQIIESQKHPPLRQCHPLARKIVLPLERLLSKATNANCHFPTFQSHFLPLTSFV